MVVGRAESSGPRDFAMSIYLENRRRELNLNMVPPEISGEYELYMEADG